MAKIKVHELAKEIEKQSKEVIAFLKEKGIEVKAAQSSVEEDVAEMVRKAFKTGNDKPEAAAPVEEKSRKLQNSHRKKSRMLHRLRKRRLFL